MPDITTYNFEGTPIRASIDEKGETWFVAKDVCEVLSFGNYRQALDTHVGGDDVQKMDIIDTLGRAQSTNIINESGLYSLILGSKLEGAKRFKRWVTAEVLPSIRKTGSYSRNPEPKQPQYAIKSEAESQASIIRDTARFLQDLVPTIRPEMAAACTLRALTSCGLLPKVGHEDLRNMLSVDWDKAPSLTPTEIGQKLGGVKPTVVNKMLEARGLQKKLGKKWEPTEEGKEYAGAVSYQAENSEHKGVQLKWAPEIVEVLQEPMDEAVVIKSKLLV